MIRTLPNPAISSLLGIAGTLTALTGTLFIHPLPIQPPAVQQHISLKTTSNYSLVEAIHTQVNQYRAAKGLASLTLDPRISEQALAHSQAMANGRVPFSHAGFQQRVQMISRVLPYSRVAENVAYNLGYQNPDRHAVQGWIKSPGHRKNMEGSFNLTGIGVARGAKGEYYFTQIFIRQR